MTLKLVPRSKWGARAPRYRNAGNLTDESTCHWNGPTVTVKGRKTWDHSYCAGLVRGIQNFHMDSRGWSDIAYNFVMCPHGYAFEGRGINIVNGANGTNAGNRSSHAICCLAGEGNPFYEAEKVGFKECVRYISQNGRAPNKCKGHRDHKATACPGDERYKWVHAGMPVKVKYPEPTPADPAKKGKKMNSFLFRSEKEIAVWLVDGDLMEKRWVQNPELLEGYKALLKANGLSDAVCVLPASNPMTKAVADVPALGPTPKGYNGPTR